MKSNDRENGEKKQRRRRVKEEARGDTGSGHHEKGKESLGERDG